MESVREALLLQPIEHELWSEYSVVIPFEVSIHLIAIPFILYEYSTKAR